MKIDINKKDLMDLRHALYIANNYILSSPDPSTLGNAQTVAIKAIKKINQALKKVYGHDCSGHTYLEQHWGKK